MPGCNTLKPCSGNRSGVRVSYSRCADLQEPGRALVAGDGRAAWWPEVWPRFPPWQCRWSGGYVAVCWEGGGVLLALGRAPGV